MYTVSQVKQINNDRTVKVGCLTSACQGCKCSMFCNTRSDTDYLALNPEGLELKAGDFVELYMPPGKTVASTMMVFALPLALFPIGYVLCKAIVPDVNELVHALAGFGAMALAFALAAVLTVRNRRALMPSITKVLDEAH